MSAVAGLRSTTTGLRAAVFGGGGFVGRYVIGLLAGGGSQVVAPSRGCELAMRHLKPMADLGGLALPAFEARDTDSIRRAVAGCDVVINLVGKAREQRATRAGRASQRRARARRPPLLHRPPPLRSAPAGLRDEALRADPDQLLVRGRERALSRGAGALRRRGGCVEWQRRTRARARARRARLHPAPFRPVRRRDQFYSRVGAGGRRVFAVRVGAHQVGWRGGRARRGAGRDDCAAR